MKATTKQACAWPGLRRGVTWLHDCNSTFLGNHHCKDDRRTALLMVERSTLKKIAMFLDVRISGLKVSGPLASSRNDFWDEAELTVRTGAAPIWPKLHGSVLRRPGLGRIYTTNKTAITSLESILCCEQDIDADLCLEFCLYFWQDSPAHFLSEDFAV